MNRNGRTQFAPTAGFASAEGWDTSRKRANTVRPYATQKKISTTQRTFLQRNKCLQRKRKFPACTVVHAGNPVIHRNPSITPFQGRVSGMGGRHPDKPPPHSHWATTGRKLLCKPGSHSRLSTKQKHGAPISENSFCCDRAIQARLIRRVICRFPFSANMSCADSFNG